MLFLANAVMMRIASCAPHRRFSVNLGVPQISVSLGVVAQHIVPVLPAQKHGRQETMKLLRYGQTGHERPGILDENGRIRDLTSVIQDLTAEKLNPLP